MVLRYRSSFSSKAASDMGDSIEPYIPQSSCPSLETLPLNRGRSRTSEFRKTFRIWAGDYPSYSSSASSASPLSHLLGCDFVEGICLCKERINALKGGNLHGDLPFAVGVLEGGIALLHKAMGG